MLGLSNFSRNSVPRIFFFSTIYFHEKNEELMNSLRNFTTPLFVILVKINMALDAFNQFLENFWDPKWRIPNIQIIIRFLYVITREKKYTVFCALTYTLKCIPTNSQQKNLNCQKTWTVNYCTKQFKCIMYKNGGTWVHFWS